MDSRQPLLPGSTRNRRRWIVPALLVGVATIALGTSAEAQPPTAGPEFQVNVYTYYRQDRPDISIDDTGAFVVVWTSEKQDGSLDGVFGRRYSAAGVAVNGEFQVSPVTAGVQNQANVAVEDDGDFVVVWRGGADAASGEIYARRFNSAGAALGTQLQVNTYTTDLQHLPAVAVDGDGDFVVTWTSERQDGSIIDVEGRNGAVFAQRFNSAGVAQSGEFQVNTYTPHGQHDPVIAMRADGFFVITWSSREQDEDLVASIEAHDGVFAQRFGSDGARLGGEFQVNTYTHSYQHHQSIGMDAEGDFTIAWHSNQIESVPDSFSDIWAKRFTSDGIAVGVEFHVNSFTPDSQEDTAVAMEADGDFVVVWDSKTQDGDAYGVFGKRFNSAGVAQSGDFQINRYTPGYQDRPAVTRSVGDGTFVVVWQSGGQDSYGYGIFARRFGVEPEGAVLDVDGNNFVTTLGDGLMILKYIASLRDANLISGGVGVGCTRCTADEIEAHIEFHRPQLDVDDNDFVTTLGDGLMILKYIASLRDANLVSGGVGVGCMRCTADEIEVYIESLRTP